MLNTKNTAPGLATDWTTGVRELDCRRGFGSSVFSTASRPALGLTQPAI